MYKVLRDKICFFVYVSELVDVIKQKRVLFLLILHKSVSCSHAAEEYEQKYDVL